MAYAIMIDWYEEFGKNSDKWYNEGHRVAIECLKDENHQYHRQMKDYLEIDENEEYPEDRVYENFEPMMNYGYKLETEPDDDSILKVILNTNCTVMFNEYTGEYFVVLTGGGMNLSQDVALAFIYLERWIPGDLLTSVSKQPCLSIGKEKYKELAEEMIYQLKFTADRFNSCAKDWEENLSVLNNFKAG